MIETKFLHEYKWPEFPDLIDRIASDQVRLFALIIADERTYFIPEEHSNTLCKAQSGRYEVEDTGPVMSALDEVHRRESSSSSTREFRPAAIPNLSQCVVHPKRFMSPDGIKGVLTRLLSFSLGNAPSPNDPSEALPILFSRIFVEEHVTSGSEKKLAAKERNAYLRLIGYMALKLKKLDNLPIETLNKAGEVIVKDADEMGYNIGKTESIAQKLGAANKVLNDSKMKKSHSK